MQAKLPAPAGASFITALLAGLLAATGLMLLLSLPAAAVVYFSPISEDVLPRLAVVIDAIALLAGGWLAARCGRRRGLLLGAGVALSALALMLLIGDTESNLGLKLAVCLLSGTVGGVLGVR